MIYADNASTTRISDKAFDSMLPFLREQYANASNLYSSGMAAKRAIEYARTQIAGVIGANPGEIIFTSGGSEGNSWVLQGIATLFRNKPVHIITSSIEHPSVINSCRELEKRGMMVTYLPVDSTGRVSVTDTLSALQPDTRLVSVMLANNETGTIQPVCEIGKHLRERGILLHTDAVQALGHIPVNVRDLNTDLLTASAHKFNGAKGTGFVYIRNTLALPQLIIGGSQENGKRAGTENVAGIVALGYALEESVSIMEYEQKRLAELVQVVAGGLKSMIPDLQINTPPSHRLPGILNVTFPGISGEAMMNLLDMKGVCVSTGSACNSGKDEPSHVLLALGLSEQQAKSSIRISLGRYNTEQQADEIIHAIRSVHSKIRLSNM